MGVGMPFVLHRLGSSCFRFKCESYGHDVMKGELLLEKIKQMGRSVGKVSEVAQTSGSKDSLKEK